MSWLGSKPDLIVVGAGLFGLTIAERVASQLDRSVLILERRPHVGGNTWSETDPESGIEFHKYGSHIFHTNNAEVWAYLRCFTTFTDYVHRVWTISQGVPFSLPINLHTLGQVFGRQFTPDEARAFLALNATRFPNPSNFEERAISLIGEDLYSLFIRGYTHKQWGVHPTLLPARMMARVPVRFSFDSRYFTDSYQGMPSDGYQAMLKRMASDSRIDIRTEVDFLHEQDYWRSVGVPIVYSGPIDALYQYRYGPLGWRTVDLEFRVEPCSDSQGAAVINYADESVLPTRTHEFRHLHPERRNGDRSILADEFSRRAEGSDEPYYPINTPEDRVRLSRYRSLASQEQRMLVGGRLGSYQYLDMHMAVASALTLFRETLVPMLRAVE